MVKPSNIPTHERYNNSEISRLDNILQTRQMVDETVRIGHEILRINFQD
jgi:hypothetical protein